MQFCTRDCINIFGQNSDQLMCDYVSTHCQQDTINFIQVHFCTFKNSFLVLLTLGVLISLIQFAIMLVLFEAVSHLSNEYLAPCVDELVASFGIGQTVAGVTFLAFANGAPDVLTAIIAGNSDSETTALIPFGSIFGALMFCSSIILSQVILHSRHEDGQIGLKINKGESLKPIIFYIGCTLAMLLISAIVGQMTWYYACLFLIAYVVYGVLVIVDERRRKLKESRQVERGSDVISTTQQVKALPNDQTKKSLIGSSVNSEQTLEKSKQPVEDGESQGDKDRNVLDRMHNGIHAFLNLIFSWSVPGFQRENWNIWKEAIQMLLSAMVFLLNQGSLTSPQIGPIPSAAWVSAIIIVLVGIVLLVWGRSPPRWMWPFQLYSFVMVVVWISLICSVIINFIELFVVVTDIDSVFIGLTLLACGNSIGDYFSIKAFAKKGKGLTAIAGILAGQLFNLLIGLGVSMLIRSINRGPYPFNLFPSASSVSEALQNSIVWVVIAFSVLNLSIILGYLLKFKFVFRQRFANYQILIYLAFIAVTVVLAIFSDIFGDISCKENPGEPKGL